MPPKGKAKAKGKAAAAPTPDVQVLDVPPPPPAPVCLPLPDSMLGRCATERCLLLSWADVNAAYKVQVRQWIPGDPTERASSADDWRDAKEIERVRMPGRGFHEGRLYAFEQIRIQYRMVLASGPKPLETFSVANWFSVPSEPVATFVDPPIGLQAELHCENDVVPATVNLTWKTSNFELLRTGVAGSSPADMDAAFASWPGLMPNKVQVRWRVVRTLSSVDEALPKTLASGNYVVSAALDKLVKDADFRIQDDTWQYTFKEASHGVIAVFSVRLGTAYKWSPWSEDSPPLVVEVHEPTPPGVARLLPVAELDRDAEIDALARSRDSDKEAKTAKCVEIRNLTDSEGEATWMPFTTEGLLTWVEYRVMLCAIEDPDASPLWQKGIVAGVVQIVDKVDQVTVPLRGLLPNQWYCVRVDARYPNVGKRSFSNSKALSPPFLTPFPSRPPLQAIPVRLDTDEEVQDSLVAEDDPEDFQWSSRPWVALRVEKGFFPDKYTLQYKDAVFGGQELGKEHFEGWQEPVVVERFGKDRRNSEQWDILRVGLPAGTPPVVVVRMMTLTPKTSGPLQWSVASSPVVSSVAPPVMAEVHGTSMRLLPTLGGLRLSLRFFLQPGAELKEGHLPHIHRAGTVHESVGHRYVTQYQLRVRMKGETHKELPAGVKGPRRYLELPPKAIPTPHAVGEVDREALGEPEDPEEVEVAGLLGYFGTRHELQEDLTDHLWELLMGHDLLEASLRVGTENRWSCWTKWSNGQGLQVPLPEPFPNAVAKADALGPTAVKVSWPPFHRVPGINSLEYVIRAEPLLAEDGSSGLPAETVICFKHEPRKEDGQIVATAEFQRLLDVKEMPNLRRLASCFQDIQHREGEEENETKVQVEMSGLLPWTSYLISVAARYPAAAGLYPRGTLEAKSLTDGLGLMVGKKLTTQVETPGGANAPSAPRQVGWHDFQHDLGEDAMFGEDQRAVLLNIEDRKDYVLEYRASAPTWAHYDPEVGPALRDFQGSWPRKEAEEGAWKRVPNVKKMGKGFGESYTAKGIAFTAPEEVIVAAEMSDLKPAKGKKLPDVVRFRLCTRDRSKAHPCCWAGGISEPVPLTFAPPRRPPRIQRVLSDDRWNLSFSIELFKANAPPNPIHYLGIEEDDDSESEEEEEEKELTELRSANFLPDISTESWEDSKLHFMPHGYGHRMVTLVQVRYSLQSSILPEMRKDLEKDVLDTDWHATSPVDLLPRHLARSNACTFELPSPSELLDSGVYIFQVRVGNGKIWSSWSHSSKAFLFQVPPPVAPTAASLRVQRPVNVEVISATAARVVWGDFKPAPGLTMLEYEVRATPEQSAGSSKAFPPQIVTFEHRFRGGFIEHELYNLLPFTYYTFSVQARYPKVGSKMWAGQQQSEPIIVEPAVAYQDPPTPLPVPEPEDSRSADSMNCYAVIEFPCEEEGMQYDLEYAHVLGDESDTAELRSVNSLWRAPIEVKLLDLGRPGNAGGQPQPRWRVQLPEISNLRNDSLKLALLQRVRFRLRARITPEGSTSRWWSSLSPPISTGFAGPEEVAAFLVPEAGRLGVEVHFQLDGRLGEVAVTAGAQELQLQREVLFQVLDSSEQRSKSKGADETPSNQSVAWPRGFGHPFATRYQLSSRHLIPADLGHGTWSSWEVFPDCALPAEQPGGTSQGKQYKCCMPLPEGRDLVAGTSQNCELVQVCVRIGDGLKWSPWRRTKELPILLEKPMASEDEAFGVWQGSVCKVAWPPVVVHAGIQEVEYQLMVIPDSAHLLPYVGAVIIAAGQQDDQKRRGRSPKKSGKNTKTSKDLPKAFPLKSVPKLVAGQARLKSVSAAHLEGLGRDDYVVTEFTELCPDLRYAFQVWARYPTVGPRTFNKIYEVDKISKSNPTVEEVDPGVQTEVTPVPGMMQVPLLEEGQEKMQRWLQDGEGSLVLLTWQGLLCEAENPRQASVMKLAGQSSASGKQYEVQASIWRPDGEGEWIPCPVVSAAFPFEGTTCIAVRSLPFAIGRFRLFDPHTMRAGPNTAPIVTAYERVEPGDVQMIAKGEPPRTLGAMLRIPLAMPKGTGGRATCCQIRFRTMRLDDEPSAWQELDVQGLPESGAIFGTGAPGQRVASEVLVREEDGLELGCVYEFQVRIGDRCRIGHWSRSFRPLKFAVSQPVPSEGSGLKVVEQGDRAEISWAPFQPDENLAVQLPSFRHLPIQYTLSVLGSCKEPLSSVVTCETRCVVHGLQPLTSYSTMLVASWSRFGKAAENEGRDKDHVLMAAFVTSGLGGKKLTAELSVRLPTEQLDGYGPVSPAVARIPLQGGQPAAVTLDLDPYYVQPRLNHYNADFVRKPTVPSQREPQEEADKTAEKNASSPPASSAAVPSEGQAGKLPSLVPMPPPKFTTRDPLSFALLVNPTAGPRAPGTPGAPPGAPRPSPRRRLS